MSGEKQQIKIEKKRHWVFTFDLLCGKESVKDMSYRNQFANCVFEYCGKTAKCKLNFIKHLDSVFYCTLHVGPVSISGNYLWLVK